MTSAMSAEHPPQAPRGSSVGALWTAGLGAFLLFAAAATFVAVRWDQIPDQAKLAALLAATATCLAAQARLRRSLPITATALLHLGVLLVPIDVAAIGVGAHWVWPQMLFAQGLAATVVFGVTSQLERSVVLRYATWAGVVVLAGGIGGLTPVPAGVVLGLVALVAVLAGPRYLELRLDLGAGAWAGLAAFATPLAAARNAGLPFDGTLTDLGLADARPHPTALVTGLVAGLALGVLGGRRRNAGVVLAGVAAVATGAITTWVGLEPDGGSTLAAVAALCLAAQVARQACVADAFWRRPTSLVGYVTMPATVVLSVGFGGLIVVMPFFDHGISPEPVVGLAAVLVAATWLLTTPKSPQAAALVGSAAVALFAGQQEPTAVALAGLGAVAVLVAPRYARHPRANQLGAVVVAAWAPLVASDSWQLAAGLAVVASLAIAEATVRASRADGGWSFGLAELALVPLGMGAVVVGAADQRLTLCLGWVLVSWLLAAVMDRAVQAPGLAPLATVPRIAMVAVLVLAADLAPVPAAWVAALVFTLALVDAVRLHEPALVLGCAVAAPFAIVSLALASGWASSDASMVVTASALVWLGLAGSLPGRWAPPALVGAVLAGGIGLVMGADNPVALSTNALLLGGAVAAVGLLLDRYDVALSGAVAMTLGVWGLLGNSGVTVTEPYVAPVAALLLAAGVEARRRYRTGSWVSIAPAVVLLGGSALAERLGGGPAWHAALAGAVGVVAVVAGSVGRLAGPLLVGTGLVVIVTVHETLGVTAGVPTPVWLAAGGTLLLAAGIAMERQGVGPVESGRRLVDVVNERFS